jgi:hypothetical protein
MRLTTTPAFPMLAAVLIGCTGTETPNSAGTGGAALGGTAAATGGVPGSGGASSGGISATGGSMAPTGGTPANGGAPAATGGKATGGTATGGTPTGGKATGGSATGGTATGGTPTGGVTGCNATGGADTGAQNATVNVDWNSFIYTIPAEDLYGYNGQAWDGNQAGGYAPYNALLRNAGFKVMRWPGGSWGDSYSWKDMECNGGGWIVSYTEAKALYSSLGIRFQPIVNFGGNWCGSTHTVAETHQLATDWVLDGALGAKYWEVGNEIMASWEEGYTTSDDYGTRFAAFYKAMKAVNPNIKVIAVGWENYTDPLIRTVLQYSQAQGVTPDGWQIHRYPGSGGNYQLLHGDLDYITEMSNGIRAIPGIGDPALCMTEWGASGNDRWIKQIGAQFGLQNLMEMAKNKWAVANLWGETYNTSTYAAAPIWYVYALLNGKFGTTMINATSNNGDIRAYASKTSDGKLTMWVANNATASRTVRVNLTNICPASAGEIWVMQGANGGGEEAYDIAINGQVHPSEANARTMSGNSIPTWSSFNVSLPASSMALIKLGPG